MEEFIMTYSRRLTLGVAALLACTAFTAFTIVPADAAQTELRVGAAAADVGNLDPHFSSSTSDRTIAAWVYGALVRFAPGSTDPSTIESDLAESWEATDNNLVWTFKLRKGVQWQHGYGEVTADDVVFSLQKSADAKRSAYASDYAAFKTIEAVDPSTVRITLANQVPSMLGLLTNYAGGFIICKKAYEERGEGFTRNPVGFGPFQLESTEPGVAITFKAHDGYFRGKPKIEKIIYRFLNAAAGRDLAFASGEVDVVAGTIDQRWLQRMKATPGAIVDIFDPAELSVLHLNRNQKPFDDIKVRQAIGYAVNPAQIAQFRGAEFTRVSKSVIPSNNLGLNPEPGLLPYDLAKAKALLAEAGYPDGITIKMISSQLPSYAQTDQILQAQLQQAGIKLDLQPVEHATWHQMIRKDLSPIVEYSAARFPVANTYLTQFYYSKSAIGQPGQVTNFSHCSVADKQIEAARTETDPKKQVELWQEAQKLIVADVCAVPLTETSQAWARTDKLEWGFDLKGSLSLGPLLTEQAYFKD
jgi:peptide/nickel transport system substrate-binding protein